MFTTTTRIHIHNQSYTFVTSQYDPDNIFEDNSGSRAKIYKIQNNHLFKSLDSAQLKAHSD